MTTSNSGASSENSSTPRPRPTMPTGTAQECNATTQEASTSAAGPIQRLQAPPLPLPPRLDLPPPRLQSAAAPASAQAAQRPRQPPPEETSTTDPPRRRSPEDLELGRGPPEDLPPCLASAPPPAAQRKDARGGPWRRLGIPGGSRAPTMDRRGLTWDGGHADQSRSRWW